MLTGNAEGAHEFRKLTDMVDVRTLTDKQEVFDHVARHLIKQGKPAITLAKIDPLSETEEPYEVCAYRGPDGCSCAVGILIHDEEYSASFEGNSISSLLLRVSGTPLAERLEPHEDMLILLQGIHDSTLKREGVEAMKIELRALAIQEGLKVPHELVDVRKLTKPQEIFDYVAEHLIRQGKAATIAGRYSSADVICAYRAEDGCTCAVGCLIADGEYDPSMERMGIGSLVHVHEDKPAIQRLIPNKALLERLQNVHDSFLRVFGVEVAKRELAAVAEEFGLEVRFDTRVDVRKLTKPQEIFDYVADHLIKQGRAAMEPNDSTRCAYRAPDGTSCAVGCLIHDTEYRPEFERKTVHGLLSHCSEMPDALRGRIENNVTLLSDLQSVHDQYLKDDGVEAAKQRLKFVARIHDLTVNFN